MALLEAIALLAIVAAVIDIRSFTKLFSSQE